MTQLTGNTKPGYTISLYVSKKQEAYTEAESQLAIRRDFPAQTTELGRVELSGEDLEKLLTKTRVHIDQIEEV